MKEQEREVERAVIWRGKYRFRPQYCHTRKYQRANCILSVSDVTDAKEAAFYSDVSGSSTSQESTGSGVSVSSLLEKLEPLSCCLGLPLVRGIARKADEILQSDNGVAPAPGNCESAKMGMRKSGKPPHLVIPKRNGGIACDSDCPHFKSAGICSML